MRDIGSHRDAPLNLEPGRLGARLFWQASLWQRLALVCMLSAIGSLGLSFALSQSAWEAWWTSEEDLQLAQDDLASLEQKLMAQRAQIAQLHSQPHPAGFSVPAWQTWPPEQALDERQVLRDWLAWGKQHGLYVQATRIESGQGAGRWEGPLPALLAAWQGLPQAVPRMVVSGFVCERMQPLASLTAPHGTENLRLQMQWTVLRENALAPVVTPKNAAHVGAGTSNLGPTRFEGLAVPAKSFVYPVFSEQSLVAAWPSHALTPATRAQPLSGWQTRPLDELRWRGTLSSGSRRWAWVASDGLVHAIKPGDRLGQDWGEVIAIEHDHLQLREWHANDHGQWVSQLRRFPMGQTP